LFILGNEVETSICLHGSWLVLIGNFRLTLVLSGITCCLFVRESKMLELNTKVNTDYIVSSC